MAYRITCVCLGNICRSPMAEVVLRERFAAAGLAGTVAVDSAGTGRWHVGSDADRRARATLEDAGYSFSHSARQFEPDWLTGSNLILAMDQANLTDLVNLAATYSVDREHIRLLRSFDPSSPPGAEVPDPYYGGPSGFGEVLAMIERAADGVVVHVTAELGR
jgi:protein-tyrosine phosphatase